MGLEYCICNQASLNNSNEYTTFSLLLENTHQTAPDLDSAININVSTEDLPSDNDIVSPPADTHGKQTPADASKDNDGLKTIVTESGNE